MLLNKAIMKLKTAILSLLVVTSVISCRKKPPTPKVIYEDLTVETSSTVKDTSSIKIADLPILIEGTDVLIHPIGDLRFLDTYSRSYGSSKTNEVSYSLSNFNRFELTGYFQNIKFQHKDSTSLKPLLNKEAQINSATFLNEFANKTEKKILVYTMVDADTNRDKKIDQNDIKSLYLSSIDGTGLIKLSKEYQELIDWSYISNPHRIYFRCLEDINKNGAFDQEDKVHYYYLNLVKEEVQPEEYFPID